MTCSTVGVDVTGMMQKGLHLAFALSELSLEMSGDTISACSSPWHDFQSAWMLWELGKYSGVSVILLPIKYTQISFEILLSSALFVPPIFIKWNTAMTFSISRWTGFGFFTLQNNSITNLAAFISETIMWICASTLLHWPPAVSSWQCAPQPPNFAASNSIIISAFWISIVLTLFKFRLWHHHFSSSKEAAFRLIFVFVAEFGPQLCYLIHL